MTTILAIETSADAAFAALLQGARCFVAQSTGVETHSTTILPMVQDVLNQAQLSLSDCDAIAYGAGPGSFTGVRTACGVTQGLAFGVNKPVVPIVSLLAMAQLCREETGAHEVLALLDARMGEVYWAHYRYDVTWHVVMEPTLSAVLDIQCVDNPDIVLCGNGLIEYQEFILKHPVLARCKNKFSHIMPTAKAVAQLAQAAFELGETVLPSQARPVYLRNHVAKTIKEREAEKENKNG